MGPGPGRTARPDDLFPMTPSPFPLQASPSPSPVGYSPMTPGAPSPGGYNPHTPGSGIEQNSSDWVTTDIQVKVRDTYLDTQVVGQTGVIRSVTVSGPRRAGGQASSLLGSPVSLVAGFFLFNCLTTSSSTHLQLEKQMWKGLARRLRKADPCLLCSWLGPREPGSSLTFSLRSAQSRDPVLPVPGCSHPGLPLLHCWPLQSPASLISLQPQGLCSSLSVPRTLFLPFFGRFTPPPGTH